MEDDKREDGLPVVPTARRRRRHSHAQKQAMVAATLNGNESVSQVARRYDVNANQLFKWRKQYRDGLLPMATSELLPIQVVDQPTAHGDLEVYFQPGTRLIVRGKVDPVVLRTILEALGR